MDKNPDQNGKVGPDHARLPVSLKIFEADLPSHRLAQKTVNAAGPDGVAHRLFLAVPRGAPPQNGWPIAYLLDGNAAFDFLTPAHLALVPGLVVVGVGYDTDRQFSRERRTLDFTAPDPHAIGASDEGLRPDHVHEGRMAGGAARFLDRLTGDLRRTAEEGLAIDAGRRTLWGHSFGGLFTLYALLSRPGAFARYAAISPSIWWDEALIQRVAAAAVPHGAGELAPELLVALGDREKRSGAGGPPPDGPAPATMDFVAGLKAHPGLAPQVHVLPGHVHIETIAGSLPLALPFAAR